MRGLPSGRSRPAPPPTLDLSDIQGGLLRGYRLSPEDDPSVPSPWPDTSSCGSPTPPARGPGCSADKDYFLGDPGETAKMTIPGQPPWFLTPQPNLVITRGGEYLFMPGMGALRKLADGTSTKPGR